MFRINNKAHIIFLIIIFNSILIKADDSLKFIKHPKYFYHDFHIGITRVDFAIQNSDNDHWKAYTLSYSIKYLNKDFSGRFKLEVLSPIFSESYISLSASQPERRSILLEFGYKEQFFLRYNKFGSIDLVFFDPELIYTKGYVIERNYSIKDLQFFYSPNISNKKYLMIRVGTGISFCDGYEEYIEEPLWHGQGWYEPIRAIKMINEIGYNFMIDVYYRPVKWFSLSIFGNYREFKNAASLFTYGISGGLSF